MFSINKLLYSIILSLMFLTSACLYAQQKIQTIENSAEESLKIFFEEYNENNATDLTLISMGYEKEIALKGISPETRLIAIVTIGGKCTQGTENEDDISTLKDAFTQDKNVAVRAIALLYLGSAKSQDTWANTQFLTNVVLQNNNGKYYFELPIRSAAIKALSLMENTKAEPSLEKINKHFIDKENLFSRRDLRFDENAKVQIATLEAIASRANDLIDVKNTPNLPLNYLKGQMNTSLSIRDEENTKSNQVSKIYSTILLSQMEKPQVYWSALPELKNIVNNSSLPIETREQALHIIKNPKFGEQIQTNMDATGNSYQLIGDKIHNVKVPNFEGLKYDAKIDAGTYQMMEFIVAWFMMDYLFIKVLPSVTKFVKTIDSFATKLLGDPETVNAYRIAQVQEKALKAAEDLKKNADYYKRIEEEKNISLKKYAKKNNYLGVSVMTDPVKTGDFTAPRLEFENIKAEIPFDLISNKEISFLQDALKMANKGNTAKLDGISKFFSDLKKTTGSRYKDVVISQEFKNIIYAYDRALKEIDEGFRYQKMAKVENDLIDLVYKKTGINLSDEAIERLLSHISETVPVHIKVTSRDIIESIYYRDLEDYVIETNGIFKGTTAESLDKIAVPIHPAMQGKAGPDVRDVIIDGKSYIIKNLGTSSAAVGDPLNELRTAAFLHYKGYGPKPYLFKYEGNYSFALNKRSYYELMIEKVEGINIKDAILDPFAMERWRPGRAIKMKELIEESLSETFPSVQEAYIAFAKAVLNDNKLMKSINSSKELFNRYFSSAEDVQFMLQPATNTRKTSINFIDDGQCTMSITKEYNKRSSFEIDYIMSVLKNISESAPDDVRWIQIPGTNPFEIPIVK